MQELQSKHIVLGLTGGVACYKVAQLCRLLTKAGATVQVVMTEAAQQFITPVTMQALSGRPVFTSQWDARPENNMAHINLSRAADAIVIAPCSADFAAKLAQGRADELLSLLCLARPHGKPLLLAPAMNREMWAHPATQRNFAQAAADGAQVLDVGQGEQACGECGDGRMLEPEELIQDIAASLVPKRLAGHKVSLAADQAGLRQKLLDAHAAAQLTPPNLKDVLEELGVSAKEAAPVMRLLCEEGALVKIKDGLYYHGPVLNDILERVRRWFENNNNLDVGSLKEILGLSRKYLISLLEYMDNERITLRVGDQRRYRGRG